MESPVDNMKRNLLEKAKSFFYQLRWLFCISVPDESDGFVQKKDIHLRQLNHVQPSEQFTKKTFCDLPNECKLAIFSYLSPHERGMVERVCMEWKELMQAPSLWNSIDLTQFKIRCYCEETDSSCLNCYEAYKDRIEKFLNYLLAIQPNIKSFRFAFDISDFEDDWMRILMRFLTSVPIANLQFAYLNWKETPEKRIQTQEILVDNSNDTMSKHRRRQRHFEKFFHFFTQSASRVSHLIMPFDWSLMSIQYIGRLCFLKTLVLRSYSVPQPKFEQCLLDELMKATPYLRRLTMSICIGSGQGMLPFVLVSKSLEYLDLSDCKGFGLVKVNLPHLKEFRGGQKPYKCSFIGNDDNDPADSMPCILQVLRLGAPKLASLNGCPISDDWMKADYEIELGDVLNQICMCFLHRHE